MAKAKRRADGRYGAKVTIGKNQYKYVCANSQKELEEKILQLKLKVGKGLDLSADRDTFEEWGKLWLKKKRKHAYRKIGTMRSQSIIRSYRSYILSR